MQSNVINSIGIALERAQNEDRDRCIQLIVGYCAVYLHGTYESMLKFSREIVKQVEEQKSRLSVESIQGGDAGTFAGE